jgi:hypothetical protein
MWCITGDRHTNKRTMTHERTRWDTYQAALQLSWDTSDNKEMAWLRAEPERQGCEDLILSHVGKAADDGALRKDIVATLKLAGFNQRSVERALTTLEIKGQVVKQTEAGRLLRLWTRAYAPN